MELEITCHDLANLLQEEKSKSECSTILIDCRTLSEREYSRIEPSEFLCLQNFYSDVAQFEHLKQSKLVIYCHHGVRSLQMTMMMLDAGFQNVKSLKGGIDAWSIHVDQTVPRY
jgi:rhodanese-related sulfurtransferase